MTVCNITDLIKEVSPTEITCDKKTTTLTIKFSVPECSENSNCTCPTSIRLEEIVNDDFQVGSITITSPTDGSTSITALDGTNISYPTKSFAFNIPNPVGGQDYSLNASIQYLGNSSGKVAVNKSLEVFINDVKTCITAESPMLTLPDCPDDCPAKDVDDSILASQTIDSCKDAADIDFVKKPYEMESLGRIIRVKNIKVKNVCPNKALAVSIILIETDEEGNYLVVRGHKSVLIPAQGEEGDDCADVCLGCVLFSLPESALDDFEENPSLCRERYFTIQVIAHHAESDIDLEEC